MAVNWPDTLPQFPGSWSEKPASNTISSEPDTGPTKTRRRFTKAKRTVTFSYLLTIAQYLILDDFYRNTMKDGLVSVTLTHPWTQQPVTLHFKDTPSYSNQDALGVSVSISAEIF